VTQFWFVHSGEVSLREQIVTQVALGIASGELPPGRRLPSTRELARRFGLHPNTVSAAYRSLERDGRVKMRRGSGVFVRDGRANGDGRSPVLDGRLDGLLDGMIAAFFEQARESGVTAPALRLRLRQWMEVQPPDHFLVVEPDEELRRIVTAEVRQAVSFPVRSCSVEECRADAAMGQGAVAVVLPSKAGVLREMLAPGAEMVTLQVRSVPGSLAEWLPAPAGALVGVASRWPEFLKFARAMLVAVGLDADSLLLRDAREKGWQRGVEQAAAVVCDVVTAEELPRSVRVIPFRLLAEVSLAELQGFEASISARLG
jgi:DNA-binding transcriptional regulator YhcF (GntR family)